MPCLQAPNANTVTKKNTDAFSVGQKISVFVAPENIAKTAVKKARVVYFEDRPLQIAGKSCLKPEKKPEKKWPGKPKKNKLAHVVFQNGKIVYFVALKKKLTPAQISKL